MTSPQRDFLTIFVHDYLFYFNITGTTSMTQMVKPGTPQLSLVDYLFYRAVDPGGSESGNFRIER